jgi:heavy metal sensor kinase
LSLRARLTHWYTATLAAALAVYTIAVFVILSRHLHDDLDLHLHEELEVVVHRVAVSPSGSLTWRDEMRSAEEEPAGARWVEVWTADGRVRLLAWASREPVDLGPMPPPPQGDSSRSGRLADGRRVRVMTKPAVLAGRPVLLRGARSEEPTHAQRRRLMAGLAVVLPLSMAAAWFVGRYVARRLFSPLVRMSERAEAITADRLDARLPLETTDDELGRLGAAFNRTLARLEDSFGRLQRFTADASHELRTPLTALRAVGEVGLREARGEAACREVIGSMLEEAERLTRLVDALLALARVDAGEAKLTVQDLDLAELARDVGAQLRILAEERGQEIVVESNEALPIRGDRLLLRQAAMNLVDNAIKHGLEGRPVRIASRRCGAAAVLEVVDQGPGIPEEHRARVFDRFYRVDRGRSRAQGGIGLGLALVQWAAQAHGGRVEVVATPGGGSTFRLTLPAEP